MDRFERKAAIVCELYARQWLGDFFPRAKEIAVQDFIAKQKDYIPLIATALREEHKATLEDVLVAIRKSPGCDIMAGSDCVCCRVADTVQALMQDMDNKAPNGGKEVE